MRHITRKAIWLLLVACCLLLAAGSLAAAQSVAGYDLSWWTADGGGGTWSSSEGYALGGTAGQPEADISFGSGYTLAGGFWGSGAVPYRLYLPIVLRAF